MYGIKKIKIEGQDISISDKERTLVDFIFKPMGSWENVQSVINAQISSIDISKFISIKKRLNTLDVIKIHSINY